MLQADGGKQLWPGVVLWWGRHRACGSPVVREGFLEEMLLAFHGCCKPGYECPEGRDLPRAWHALSTLAHLPHQMHLLQVCPVCAPISH